MANFWLPVESDSPGKIEVRRLARLLSISRHEVVGRLLQVWFWFSIESETGIVAGGTCEDVDSVSDLDGFAKAMIEVGWLKMSDEGIEQPGFHEHRQVSQKELRKRGRALKSKDKSSLLAAIAGTAKDRGELVEWLLDAVPELADLIKQPEAQQVCAKGAATRRRRETPQQKTNPKPAGRPDLCGDEETAGRPPEVLTLPDWPACEPYGGQLVTPEEPPAGYFADGNAFENLTPRHLRSPAMLAEWHRRQLSLSDPPVGPTVAHLMLLLATAETAGGKRVRNPVGLFVSAVSRGEWKCERALPEVVKRWQRAALGGLIDTDTHWIHEAKGGGETNVEKALAEMAPLV